MVNVGDRALDFELETDQSGEQGGKISLLSLKGKWIVLYFYPKDNTSGCTAEACDFRDHYPQFQALNTVVLGVSKDSLKSHGKFRTDHSLTFPLLSDESGEVCEKYGVWVEKSMYGKKYFGIERSTFLIDAEGGIAHIWRKVKVPHHVEEVLETIRNR